MKRKGMRSIGCICAVLTCLAMLVLSGCDNQKQNRITRITVAGWNIQSDAFMEQKAGFEVQNPDIQVDVRYVDNLYTSIMPQLMAGVDIPDIVQFQNRDFPYFLEKCPDMFMDITSYVEPLKEQFVDASWDSVTKDGKIYGIPTDMGPAALFYRADLFEQAGIDAKSIHTWDDMIEANKKLQAATNGKTFITGFPEDSEVFDIFLNIAGGSYVSDDNKTVIINSPEGKKAMEVYCKMIRENAALNIHDWDGRLLAMKRNQIAAVPYGCWFAGSLASFMPEQKGLWKVMPLPAMEPGGNTAANSGGSVVAIYKNTTNPDAAWRFLNYALCTLEGEKGQLHHGLFPAFIPIYDDSEFKKADSFFGTDLNMYFAEIGTRIPPMHRGPITMDSAKAMLDMMNAAAAGKDPSIIMDEAAAAIAAACGLKVAE